MTPLSPWLAPPRRLLVAFVLLLLVPAIAVVWLDRSRRLSEQREVAVNRATSTLELRLTPARPSNPCRH
jgi:hypothetical protein